VLLKCGAADPDHCIEDHVYPWLLRPVPQKAGGYRARATCHKDISSTGDLIVNEFANRVSWHCFARCPKDRSRNALIELGVRAACLIRPAADLSADLDAITAVIGRKATPAHKVLLITAILNGYEELPRGRQLEALAELCGITGREAYKARAAGLRP
jgi:hypothetical protein